jgi:hypothetical protein
MQFMSLQLKVMKKLVLGLGIASGALLAAYLITGDRGHRTKNYIVRRARNIKENINPDYKNKVDEPEIHYV